jgi:hypothetical protein
VQIHMHQRLFAWVMNFFIFFGSFAWVNESFLRLEFCQPSPSFLFFYHFCKKESL